MPGSGTKVTIVLTNGTSVVYHATTAVSVSADGKKKTFTGKKDGETTDGAITLHIGTYVSQKEEPE